MSIPEEDPLPIGSTGEESRSALVDDDPDSTVGVGTIFAIGCTLLMAVVLLAGLCIFIGRQLG